MSFPKTTTLDWGRYAQNIYMGKFKHIGIASRIGVNKVVTRMTTSEKGSDNNTWIGIDFTPVGMFNPTDYGIDPNQAPVPNAAAASCAVAAEPIDVI
ncbi:hypothetical protein SDC9_184608 [bioreactor metagenome]|uniref:Uncharacterized protein n=1 Tax=bioreactor metagenome TaxID=1076179 RepID=A0A645HFD2_9ZZZZ